MKNTGTTEQALLPTTSQSTRQAPSIRVHHDGHVAHYLLHLIRVIHWLADYLPRMPVEHRETEDWLQPAWTNMSANSDVATMPPPQQ
uniref:Uncharacterized protein n=1 Tax=Mesocestoides corti TaxID=53468 RepID=A0A5K3G5V0_MESCO